MTCFSRFRVAALVLCLFTIGSAQEWTRFRGPNGTGLSEAKTVPTTWTARDINWRVPLPGQGHSSPALWGAKVFITSGDDQAGKRFVLCLDAEDGHILWQKAIPFSTYRKHDYNSFASSSPAVDDQRLYVCWTVPEHYTLLALDHEGKQVWQKDLGPFVSQHGGGT
jgi:outer membrane protein assembly factor BamB